MILSELQEASLDETLEQSKSILAASGYEARSRCIVEVSGSRLPPNRVVLQFGEHQDFPSRISNDRVFASAGFRGVVAGGSESGTVESVLLDLLNTRTGPIAIDISSMTRAWYGAIVRLLMCSERDEPATVYFSYFPRRPPTTKNGPIINQTVGPVPGFASAAPPTSPVALIIGMGNNRDQALGLQELLDPKRTILMVPRLATGNAAVNDEEFVVRPESVLYPLYDPVATFRILESLSLGLRGEYHVVFASLGPKLFGLMGFLLTSLNPEISVWRVSHGDFGLPENIEADIENLILCRTVWRNQP